MKALRQSIILVMFVLAFTLLFAGCSQMTSKPSDSEMKEAIKAELKSPDSLSHLLFSGTLPKSDKISIEIKQWGDFNKEMKYWPVKVRMSGDYIAPDFSFNPFVTESTGARNVRHFDRVADCKFHKDDYGKWKAEIVVPGLH